MLYPPELRARSSILPDAVMVSARGELFRWKLLSRRVASRVATAFPALTERCSGVPDSAATLARGILCSGVRDSAAFPLPSLSFLLNELYGRRGQTSAPCIGRVNAPRIPSNLGPRYPVLVSCPECARLDAELNRREVEYVQARGFLTGLAESDDSTLYQRVRAATSDCGIDVRLAELEIGKHRRSQHDIAK
jgi:hypothetical protein